MDTDDIGCLADLLSDSRASGGVGCGIVHSKSSKVITMLISSRKENI